LWKCGGESYGWGHKLEELNLSIYSGRLIVCKLLAAKMRMYVRICVISFIGLQLLHLNSFGFWLEFYVAFFYDGGWWQSESQHPYKPKYISCTYAIKNLIQGQELHKLADSIFFSSKKGKVEVLTRGM
jgi:hypothetical protein